MLNVKKEIALNAFRSGFNCAQSVLKTRALEQDIMLEQAMAQASGFGGGMGRLQKTCGAVTGAYMSIGFHNSKHETDPDIRKELTSQMIRQFHAEFEQIHGFTDCRSLINCDISTESGRTSFEENDLGSKICEKCILSSLEILEKLLA